MLIVGNPRVMRSVLGHDSRRGAVGERGDRAGDKSSATRHRDFWLATAPLRSTYYPWER